MIFNRIDKLIGALDLAEKNDIHTWQQVLFMRILFFAAVLGSVAYVPSVIFSIKEAYWPIAIMDTIAYGGVLFLVFSRRLSFEFKTLCFPLIVYAIGLTITVTLGPFGDGLLWLFCFPLLAGMLQGYRRAIMALCLNGVTLLILVLLLQYGILSEELRMNFDTWQQATGNALERWGVISINFMFMSTGATMLVTTILKNLTMAHDRMQVQIKERTQQLETANKILKKEVNDRRQAEKKLIEFNHTLDHKIQENTRELRLMNDHLIRSEEKTRRQVAADLHDSVAQSLAISVSKLKNIRENEFHIDISDLQPVQEYIEQAIREIRTMISTLSPPVLDDFGIDTAIGILIEQTNEKNLTQIRFENLYDNTVQLSEAATSMLYRAAGELVCNFLKHSGTLTSKFCLSTVGDHVSLVYEDQGVGMRVDRSEREFFSGFGLYGLSGRVRNMGGRVDIISAPEQGTKIMIEIPASRVPAMSG